MESNNYKVYVHTSPSGKKYVGITGTSVEQRWGNGCGYHSQPFYGAIKKYGWQNIEHIVVADHLSLQDAEIMERELIAQYHSNQKQFGYNCTPGGSNLGVIDEDHPSSKALYCVELDRIFPSAAAIERELGIYHAYVSSVAYGKCATAFGMHFIFASELDKVDIDKLVASHRQYKKRPVICLSDGMEFASISSAATHYNIKYHYVWSCCKGALNKAGGLVFIYKDQDSEQVRIDKFKYYKNPVMQFSVDGALIHTFYNAKEAADIYGRSIYNSIYNTARTAAGYIWIYQKDFSDAVLLDRCGAAQSSRSKGWRRRVMCEESRNAPSSEIG